MAMSCHCPTDRPPYRHSMDCGYYEPPTQEAVMPDEIKKVEDEVAYRDMGKMGYLVFQGALDESDGDKQMAYIVMVGYFRGIASGSLDYPSEDADK